VKKKTCQALRGAACTANTEEGIAAAAVELYDALLRENALAEEDIISLLFSVTPDLDALNPAAALRKSGRARELAMMVFQEAAVTRTLPGTIRALVHCYGDPRRAPRHIYLRGAETLRPDWAP
jgi:chorismate mutase